MSRVGRGGGVGLCASWTRGGSKSPGCRSGRGYMNYGKSRKKCPRIQSEVLDGNMQTMFNPE